MQKVYDINNNNDNNENNNNDHSMTSNLETYFGFSKQSNTAHQERDRRPQYSQALLDQQALQLAGPKPNDDAPIDEHKKWERKVFKYRLAYYKKYCPPLYEKYVRAYTAANNSRHHSSDVATSIVESNKTLTMPTHDNYMGSTTQHVSMSHAPIPNPSFIDANNPNPYIFPNIVNDAYSNQQNQIPPSQMIQDKYRTHRSLPSSSWHPYSTNSYSHYVTNNNNDNNNVNSKQSANYMPYIDENNNRSHSSMQGTFSYSTTTPSSTHMNNPPSPHYNSRRPPQMPTSTHMRHTPHSSHVHILPTNVVRTNNATIQSPQYGYFDPQQEQ